MSCQIDSIRTQLWELIRRYQHEGGVVSNSVIQQKLGNFSQAVYDGKCLCLLGVIAKYHRGDAKTEGVTKIVRRVFDISCLDALALEDGFENWSDSNSSPYYKLGREIGAQIEKEVGIK